jgi:hypothetical protein
MAHQTSQRWWTFSFSFTRSSRVTEMMFHISRLNEHFQQIVHVSIVST